MAFTVSFTIFDTQSGQTEKRSFVTFPVRIGRNRLNDLRLSEMSVSQFHAVLERHGTKTILHDLGSKNGIFLLHGRRVQPNSSIALENGDEFLIPPYSLRAEVIEAEAAQPARRDFSEDPYTTMRMLPTASRAPSAVSDFEPLYSDYARARSAFYNAVSATAVALEEEQLELFSQAMVQAYPSLESEPQFREICEPIPVDLDSGRGLPPPSSRRDPMEVTALEGLRALVASYLPRGPSLYTPEDVGRFLGMIEATLNVLFRCFVPLRDGHKQFATQMLDRSGTGPSFGAPVASLDVVRTEGQVAQALLDWSRNDNVHATASGVFADLMIHQVALLNGVMEGVKSLLAELSPDAIQQAAEDPKKNRGSLGIGPFRYKQFWETYMARHADLAEEERFAFEVIFGRQFADAYRQFNAAAKLPSMPPPPRKST